MYRPFLAAAIVLALAAGCAGRRPSTPLAPAADIRNDSLCFFTTSTDPMGLKMEYVFAWGSGDTTVTGMVPSGDTAWCAHAFADTGTFSIRVQARNEQGRASSWSGACTFRASHPPRLTDTIAGSVRWVPGRWYRVSVRVVDPDGDSVAARFVSSDSTATSWSDFRPSNSVFVDSFKWSSFGPRTLRVALKDKGNMTALSGQRKRVAVSELALMWDTYATECYPEASPTVGIIDGQELVYVVTPYALQCFTRDGVLKWAKTDSYPDTEFAAALDCDAMRLYSGDDIGYGGLFCYDARTGLLMWRVESLETATCTPVLGPNRTVYITSDDDQLFLYKVRDLGDSARVEWSFPLDQHYSDFRAGVALSRDGTIYCCGTGGEWTEHPTFYALDTNGQVLWADSTHLSYYGAYRPTPCIDSRNRVIIGDGLSLFCFNPDGTIAWNQSLGEFYDGGITIGYDDRIYLQDGYGGVHCYDANGSEQWSYSNNEGPGDYNNVCAVSDSSILVYNSLDDILTALDRDGRLLWEYSAWDSMFPETPRKGRRDEGDECTSPVIGPGGTIYLSGIDCLYGIDWYGRRTAATAWPTYGHDPAHTGWAGRPWK